MFLRFRVVRCYFAIVITMISAITLSSCSGKTSEDQASVSSSDSSAEGISMDSALKLADADSTTTKKDEKVAPTRIRSKAEIDQFIANSPNRAKYEEGIIPTMAEYVPEYASKLLDNTHNGFLIVDKNTMKLYRYDKYGVLLESVGIACSKFYGTKHKKADNRTPEGFFTIKGIFDSTDWLYTNDAGYTSPARGQFGPRFMRLDTPVTQQVGIHGTAAPGSIGGRRSHGCIRMTNENILRIHKLCDAGMPVIVSPGPRDMAVNEHEGYHVPSVPVTKGGIPCKAGSASAYELENPASKKPDASKTSDKEVDVEADDATTTPDAPAQQNQESTSSQNEKTSAPATEPAAPAKQESTVKETPSTPAAPVKTEGSAE